MPLPTLVTPRYEIELPSTGETLIVRPFLVKEEKLLTIALASEDTKQMAMAIKEVLQNCVISKGVKVETLPTFDIEYVFLYVRGKSVGEEIEVKILCEDDGETEVTVNIDLDDIKVIKSKDHTNKFKIDESVMIEMKYPSLNQFVDNHFMFSNNKSALEESFDLIADCIGKVFTEEEAWSVEDCSKKELREFVESLNSDQFSGIQKFFDTMPKLSHTIKVKNPKTKKINEVVLEGLASFFA